MNLRFNLSKSIKTATPYPNRREQYIALFYKKTWKEEEIVLSVDPHTQPNELAR